MKKRIITIIASIVVAFSTMLNIIPVQNMIEVRADAEQKEAIDGIKKYIKKNGEYDKELKLYSIIIPLNGKKYPPSVIMAVNKKDNKLGLGYSCKDTWIPDDLGGERLLSDVIHFYVSEKNKTKISFFCTATGYFAEGILNKDEYSGEPSDINYNKISKKYAKKDSIKLINRGLKNIDKALKKYTDYTLYDLGFENY